MKPQLVLVWSYNPLQPLALRSLVVAICVLGFAVCGRVGPALSKEQLVAGAGARLTVAKGYKTRPGRVAVSFYAISEAGDCTSWRRLPSFTWTSPQESSSALAAGAPVVVFGDTQYKEVNNVHAVGGYYFGDWTDKSCWNAVRFTPVPRHTYRIVHVSEHDQMQSCSLLVRDESDEIEVGVAVPMNIGACRAPAWTPAYADQRRRPGLDFTDN